MREHVLVTGSAGRVGRAVVKALVAAGESVVGFDLRATPGLPAEQSVVGSLADVAELNRAARGAKCIVHLAAAPDDSNFPRRPGEGDNFVGELVPNNIVGTYSVLEAARVHSVPRVILASTGQVIDGYLRDGLEPVTTDLLPRPRYLYACTKVFLEAIGQVYARQHGITVLAVRLGWVPRDLGQVNEIRASEIGQDVYFSPGDVGRFFHAAATCAGLPNYAVVYATSRFTHTLRYNLSETTRLTGWEPRDQWDAGATDW